MTKRIYAILVLIGLFTFSCEKMEITRSDQPSPFDLANPDLKDLRFKPACNYADATIRNITITAVAGNTFDYNFTVMNIGGSALPLSQMYFQTYLSTDNVFDGSDVPAGGSIFGDTAPTLAFGDSYLQHWYYNPTSPVNVTDYHFLVIQLLVRPKFMLIECSTANNVRVHDIGCNLADGYVSDITFTSVDYVANTFSYNFTVTNSGWGALNLSQMLFQTYISTDAVLGAGDKAAGGAIFGSSAPSLNKDDTYAQSWYYNPSTPEDISIYKYLIVQLQVWSGTVAECNTANNTFVVAIAIDIPRDGLVAFYPFNSNANDESGNGLHGTAFGPSLHTDRFGVGNRAYSFDGADDYIAVGNPALLQINGAITLSVWVKNSAFDGSANILSKTQHTNPSGTEGHGYKLRLTATGDGTQYYGAFIHYPGFGGVGSNFAGGAPFSLNEWVNFTFTLDGTNAKWYKNGVEEFSVTNHQPLSASSLGNFEIGRGSAGGFNFTGQIDDIAVYNRALSPEEVVQLYNQNITH